MTVEYMHAPTAPDQRVDSLFAWVATHADGAEGIMSGDMPYIPGLGRRHMPFMSSKRTVAESLGPRVAEMLELAVADGVLVKAELVEFIRVRPPP